MGFDQAAAARRAAFDDEIVALDRSATPAGREARGDRREAIALLDAQFVQSAHAGHSLGESRGDRKDRIFVDHRGRARGGHVDAA